MQKERHIETYIGQLLYEHDCVVVPGLGGFIGNYASARIDTVKHLFEPPGKNILFNKGLIQNDGLLANHISHSLKISYNEAINFIEGEAKRIRASLQQSKRIELDGVGLLYSDEHGNLLFQPDDTVNYLPEAFGLSSFYRLPVAQPEHEKEIIPIRKNGNRVGTWAAAAAIGAVITSAFWLSLNTFSHGIDYSGLNIFAKKEARLYQSFKENRISIPTISNDTVAPIAFLNNRTAVNASKATAPAAGNFLIVAGCFRILDNAQGLVKKMNQQKVNASIIGTNPQGLYMVGYGSFATREQAEEQLNTFRKSYVADAWVFERTASGLNKGN